MAIGESDPQSRAVLSPFRTTGLSPNREADPIATRQLTQLQLAWIRLRRHRLGMIGLGVMIFLVLMAIFAPLIAPENIYDPNSNDIFGAADKAPTLHDGLRYLFGADNLGRSVTSLIIWGARYTLLISFTATITSTLIGVVVGGVAGFYGGWVDSLLMRVVDVFLTLPALSVLLVAAAVFGHGNTTVLLVIIVFTVLGWAYIARLVRGSFLSLRSMEFTEAARSVGVSNARIIFRHILPNALRPVLVATTLGIAGNISFEAAIDFLGFGLQYPDTSWGTALAFASQEQFRVWWVTVWPGVFLTITIVAINFVGDGLSDALDVRSKN
ncbi:MAG: ABC-type dipeptide transport system, permease component [Chloroflexi bacterium]|nr:ABC-type dipeptide transport system, permease component [Chloroflexota bacterium]